MDYHINNGFVLAIVIVTDACLNHCTTMIIFVVWYQLPLSSSIYWCFPGVVCKLNCVRVQQDPGCMVVTAWRHEIKGSSRKNAQCLDGFPLQARSHDLERGRVHFRWPNDQCV